MEQAELAPRVDEDGVGHIVAVRLVERHPDDGPLDENGSLRPGLTGDHDVDGLHTSVAGQQRDVGLVLDLLQAGQVERGAQVLIGHEAVGLGEELRVGLVASDDPHGERTLVVLTDHERGPLRLFASQTDAVCSDAELGKRGGHLGRGGAPAG